MAVISMVFPARPNIVIGQYFVGVCNPMKNNLTGKVSINYKKL
jgi:hypothetical protein